MAKKEGAFKREQRVRRRIRAMSASETGVPSTDMAAIRPVMHRPFPVPVNL